ITVVWRLTGPIAGEVVVRSPFGEVCRSTVLVLGSCTVTFPFDQRGQTIPLDVIYAGSPDFSPASAVVTRTLVGCYQLSLAVVPAGAGAISGPSGSCNAGTGFFGGTPVSVVIQPNQGYVFDRWLEDGGTLRTRSFVVGEGSQSATAIMQVDCVDVKFTTGEQVDSGPLRWSGGHVDVSPPNCPGRTDVERDPATGDATAWFLRGSDVTLTGTVNRPQMDEL